MTLLQNGIASSVATLIVMIGAAWLWVQFHSFWAIVLLGMLLFGFGERLWWATVRWWKAGKV